MKIQSNSSIYFRAKNPEIRFADDIVRKVNKEFPRISHSFVADFKHANEFTRLTCQLSGEINYLRSKTRRYFSQFDKEKKLKAIVDPIREMQRGNCAEAAFLSIICAKINGLKDVKFASLFSPSGYEYDHAVILANKDKKPYVLDAWLGFADYLPNAVKKWQNEFGHHFDFKDAGTNQIVLKQTETTQKSFLEELPMDIMQKVCPNLILPKK